MQGFYPDLGLHFFGFAFKKTDSEQQLKAERARIGQLKQK
jgi:hypothetical protein